MPEIKSGDRVHVEYDGVVAAYVTGATAYMVDVDGGCRSLAHRRNITVITPPVKVGDIVTADNIGQLPPRSIIARPGFDPMRLTDRGVWTGSDPGNFYTANIVTTGTSPVILRIGGGE